LPKGSAKRYCELNDSKRFYLKCALIYLNLMYRPGTSISKAKVRSSQPEDGQYNKVQQ